jgi:trans-aconitate methyltransferase
MKAPVVDWGGTLGTGSDYYRFVLLAGMVGNMAQGPTLLDIGCGPGTLRPLVSRFDYTGLDLSESDIRTALERDPGSRYILADADSWQSSQMFDVIVFNEVLYYLDDFDRTLHRYFNLLKDGGVLAVSIFNKRGLWKNVNMRALRATRKFLASDCFEGRVEATLEVSGLKYTINAARLAGRDGTHELLAARQ